AASLLAPDKFKPSKSKQHQSGGNALAEGAGAKERHQRKECRQVQRRRTEQSRAIGPRKQVGSDNATETQSAQHQGAGAKPRQWRQNSEGFAQPHAAAEQPNEQMAAIAGKIDRQPV